MIVMNLDNLVHSLVSYELDGKGREREALYFNFDLRMHFFQRDANSRVKEFGSSRGLHLLYHQFPGHRTITVFTAITKSCFAPLQDVPKWKHVASHDECWKYDNRSFHEVYMEMADEINQEMLDAGYKDVAPNDMSQNCYFAGLGSRPPFQWVPAAITKDPEDKNNYRRLVEVFP